MQPDVLADRSEFQMSSEYSNAKTIIIQPACASGTQQENGISSTDYLKITIYKKGRNWWYTYSTWNVHVSYAWNIKHHNTYSEFCFVFFFYRDNSSSGFGIWDKSFQSLRITTHFHHAGSAVLINKVKVNSGIIRGNSACNWEQPYLSASHFNGNQLERGQMEHTFRTVIKQREIQFNRNGDY